MIEETKLKEDILTYIFYFKIFSTKLKYKYK